MPFLLYGSWQWPAYAPYLHYLAHDWAGGWEAVYWWM